MSNSNMGKLSIPTGDGASIIVKEKYVDDPINNPAGTKAIVLNGIGEITSNLSDQFRSIELKSDTELWNVTGAALSLRNQFATSTDAGSFRLRSYNKEKQQSYELLGYAYNGELYWDNYLVEVNWTRTPKYTLFKSGLGIIHDVQELSLTSEINNYTLPIPLINMSLSVHCNYGGSSIYQVKFDSVGSSIQFKIIDYSGTIQTSGTYYLRWLIIGRWE